MYRILALTLLSLTAAAQTAMACPQQNENFLIPEYSGQENVFVGFIDTWISQVEEAHSNFYIEEVKLNGKVLCDSKVRGKGCSRVVSLKKGPLKSNDHVRVVLRESFSPNEIFVFERFSEVKDQGTKCRPIYAK